MTDPSYREFLDATAWYAHAGERNQAELTYLTLGLVGEAGEFADNVKKIVRIIGQDNIVGFQGVMENDVNLKKLIGEAADVLWYLSGIADFLGLTLDELAVMNISKLFYRLKYNHQIPSTMEWPLTSARIEHERPRPHGITLQRLERIRRQIVDEEHSGRKS